MSTLNELCTGLPVDPLPPVRTRNSSVAHAPVRNHRLNLTEKKVFYFSKTIVYIVFVIFLFWFRVFQTFYQLGSSLVGKLPFLSGCSYRFVFIVLSRCQIKSSNVLDHRSTVIFLYTEQRNKTDTHQKMADVM